MLILAVGPVRNSTVDLLLYTPMSPVLQAEWHALLGFIANEGRYAVQIFLVIGGFLAAQSLFKKRFLRLAKPFWVAIALAVLLGWLGSQIAVHDEISGLPSLIQLLAHVFLLDDIVAVD